MLTFLSLHIKGAYRAAHVEVSVRILVEGELVMFNDDTVYSDCFRDGTDRGHGLLQLHYLAQQPHRIIALRPENFHRDLLTLSSY